MSLWARKVLIGCAALAIVGLAGMLFARPHIWLKLSEAVVRVNGHADPPAAIYRSADGRLLVLIHDSAETAPYLVVPSYHVVVVPNDSAFLRNGYFAWSYETHPAGVSVNDPKADLATNPRPVFLPGVVEFTSLASRRVRVELLGGANHRPAGRRQSNPHQL